MSKDKRVYIDERQFIRVEEISAGVEIRLPVRVVPGENALEFKDKDRFRSAARGSEFVYISFADLIRLLEEISAGVDEGG